MFFLALKTNYKQFFDPFVLKTFTVDKSNDENNNNVRKEKKM